MRSSISYLLAGLMATAAACGGAGEGNATRTTVTGATGPDGAPAVYRTGDLPAPHGGLTATVPGDAQAVAINGGSVMVSVDGGAATITAVYVSVMGSGGYWEVTLPAGASVADVLLTLAQELPTAVTVVFEVTDAAGNVSPPVTVDLAVHQVGTGDVQVSVAWDVDNDLDLHVVDPNGVEVYWASEPTPEGGALDLDSNPDCDIDRIRNENIVWPAGRAPHGTYTVRVDNFENCTAAATSYVVTVQRAGAATQTFTGSFAAEDEGDFGGVGDGVTVATFAF
jgi:hypothetical protein